MLGQRGSTYIARIIGIAHDTRVKPLPNFLAALIVFVAGASAVAVGCGSNNETSSIDAGLVIGDSSSGGIFGGGGGDAGDGGGLLQGTLEITPTAPSVTVTPGQPLPTVQFMATVGGMKTGVAWGLDRGELGTIDQTGLFTPAGNIAGTGTISAVYGGQKVTTTITVNLSITQQGDPAWMAIPDGGTLDAGTGGYGGVGGDGPGPAPSPAQMMALGSAAPTMEYGSLNPVPV